MTAMHRGFDRLPGLCKALAWKPGRSKLSLHESAQPGLENAMNVAIASVTTRMKIPPRLLAVVAILLARWAAHGTLAMAHPKLSMLGLLWVTADALMLALMASSPRHRPDASSILGALAAAAWLSWCNAPPPLRAVVSGSWVLSGVMAGIVLLHLLVSSGLVVRSWNHAKGLPVGERLEAAARSVLPAGCVRLVVAEVRLLWLALFTWRAAPHVPAGCQGFGYHRHLAPQMWALLALVVIEAMAEHILIAHWSPHVGFVLAVVGDVSVVYMIGLVKSLRLLPVLLTQEGVRVRAGMMIDRFIPYDQIAGVRSALSGEDVRAATTWSMGLLAWPNVMIDLKVPIRRRGLKPGGRLATSLAFRLDEPEPFLRLLKQRLGSE